VIVEIYARGADDVWAAGSIDNPHGDDPASDSTAVPGHWDGTRWDMSDGRKYAYTGIADDGDGGLWLSDGNGGLDHRAPNGESSRYSIHCRGGTTMDSTDVGHLPGTPTTFAIADQDGDTVSGEILMTSC
jgi:hypothetical protein